MRDTGAAGYLPPERQWLSASIGDIAVVDWGNTTLTKKAYSQEGEFLGVSAAGCDGRMDFAEHKALTPVLSAIGANCGRMFLPREDFTAIKNTITLTPKEGVCDSVFLYYLLDSVDLPKRGAGQPFISKGDIQNFPISIPPLDEQKRIVAVLDQAFAALDRARAHAEANLAASRIIFSRIATSIFQEVSITDVAELPVAKIAEKRKGSMRTGPFGSQLKHSEFVEDGIAVLGIDNAVKNVFQWGKSRYITEEKYSELARYRVFPGDVVITIMGTCGRCAVIPEDVPVAINTKHLCCITLDKTKCLPEYLHRYFLLSPKALQYLDAQSKGTVMDGLNMGIIKDLPVDLPSVRRQKEICVRIDELDRLTKALEHRYKAAIEDLGNLRQSLLQKAFSGELT